MLSLFRLLILAGSSVASPESCIRLQKGESALIRYSSEESPTGIPAAYRLQRVEDALYRVSLHLRFEAAADYEGPFPREKISGEFLLKTRQCISENADRLHASGVRLEIALSESPDLPPHRISVRRAGLPSHRAGYSSDISCPEILHETLHLLGLVDEYFDDRTGYKLEGDQFVFASGGSVQFPFSCRVPGLPDSIMRSQQRAALNSSELEEVEVSQCECGSDQNCESLAARSDGLSCPPGTIPAKGKQLLLPGSPVNAIANPRFFVLKNVEPLATKKTRYQESLLRLVHLRAITEPGCSVNECYYSFARNAYRFEVPPGPFAELPHPSKGCLPIPTECGSRDSWIIK